jgi:hypothetical protein
VGWFQLTTPARLFAQNSLYCSGVPPISEADRPKRVLFASSIAPRQMSDRTTWSSGPKSSISGRSRISVYVDDPGRYKGASGLDRAGHMPDRPCRHGSSAPESSRSARRRHSSSMTGPMNGAPSACGSSISSRSVSFFSSGMKLSYRLILDDQPCGRRCSVAPPTGMPIARPARRRCAGRAYPRQ